MRFKLHERDIDRQAIGGVEVNGVSWNSTIGKSRVCNGRGGGCSRNIRTFYRRHFDAEKRVINFFGVLDDFAAKAIDGARCTRRGFAMHVILNLQLLRDSDDDLGV